MEQRNTKQAPPDLILDLIERVHLYLQAATTPGHSLNFAYQRKVRGSAEDCRRQGIAFLPIVVESLGGDTSWHRQR